MQRLMEERSIGGEGEGAPARPPADMMLRLYSAIVLVAVALFMTLASVESFAILVVLFISAMAWEWGRLVRSRGFDLAFGAQLAATWLASWAAVEGSLTYALGAIAAGAGLAFVLRLIRDELNEAWWSGGGVFYAGLPAVSLIWLRGDPAYGLIAVLYLFAIVWTTDSAAYGFGRWLGGPKLAPRISPKKTWAGLVGGVVSAGAVGMLFGWVAALPVLWSGGLGAALALISQMGDLGESGVKRIFGIKDSSRLIPGHGGVLDRIDGLIFAAVAAGAIAWLIDPAEPGRSLFFPFG
jgi:phosphatidate cytidylyltransferase